MNIDYPLPEQIGQLRTLWKAAFGDTDAFLDIFFEKGFSPRRCRCVSRNGSLAGALYWFDASCNGQKLAYLYGIATDPDFRGQGLCRALVDDAKKLLAANGFSGLLLVPENESLAAMYRKMGFEFCTGIEEFSCTAGEKSIPCRVLEPTEYARLRRRLLPTGGVIQEEGSLSFLSEQAMLLGGTDWICAAYSDDGVLQCRELLGSWDAAPGILRAMGFDSGIFRIPGKEIPFAMGCPLCLDWAMPEYFGLAFD